ncbi:MAG: TolC family protein [Desulfobacterales bacterium]|nr:TolC family protein [Desulfobacterales bacterium]
MSLRWDGFTGFRRIFDAKATRADYKAAKEQVNLTKDDVLIAATRQYYLLLQDKLNTEIYKSALEQTQAQLRINQQRFEAGVGTRFDVLRAEAEVASAQQDLIAANNRLKLAQAQLANTMGISIFTELIPADGSVEMKTLLNDCSDLSKIVEIAIKNKPELDIAQFNIQAARARRNSAYSIYLPNVGVRTTVNWEGESDSDVNQNQSVALIANWSGGENLSFVWFNSRKIS